MVDEPFKWWYKAKSVLQYYEARALAALNILPAPSAAILCKPIDIPFISVQQQLKMPIHIQIV